MELLLWRMEWRKTSGWWLGRWSMGRTDRPYTRLGHRSILVDCFISRVRISSRVSFILISDSPIKQYLLSVCSHTTTTPHLGLCINFSVQSPGAHDILLGFHSYFIVLLARRGCRVCLDGNNRRATLRKAGNDGRSGYICSEG